jgi:CHAT domain-containing protein
MSRRSLLLILLLAVAAGVWYTQHSRRHLEAEERAQVEARTQKAAHARAALKLDPDVVHTIERFIAGVTVLPAENNLNYAIKLDHSTGRSLHNQFKYQEAYEVYRKVLKISYDQGSLRGIQIALGVISDVLDKMNRDLDALEVDMAAYQVALQEKDRFEYGVVEKRIADKLAGEDRGLATMWRLRARKDLDGTPYVHDYAALLVDLAEDMEFLGRAEEALDVYREAYETSRKIAGQRNVRWVWKRAVTKYARALRTAGRCDEAIRVIEESLPGLEGEDDFKQGYRPALLMIQGTCHAKLGAHEKAGPIFMEAYADYELRRAQTSGEKERAEVDRIDAGIVNAAVEQLLIDGRVDDALLLLESNKARTLADIQLDPDRQASYQTRHELELRHAAERRALFDRPDEVAVMPSTRAIMKAYEELETRQARERLELQLSQHAQAIPTAGRMTAEQLESIHTSLPGDTAVLSVASANDRIYLFVISAGKTQWIDTGVEPRTLRQKVRELRAALLNPNADYYRAPSLWLYQRVFGPSIDKLGPGVRRLVYSPDGWLANVPLGTLHDGKRFLAERYAIARFPSLRYYVPGSLAKPWRAGRGVACVDPAVRGARLPFQRETGQFLQKQMGDSLTYLEGEACTVDSLTRATAAMAEEGFVHVGAHGYFDRGDSLRSGVLLGGSAPETAFWNASDIAGVDFSKARIVTLSSCETGMIDDDTPRDVFGVLRSLYYAGAQYVVAPLWAVEDVPTAELMQSFYAHYLQSGRLAESLQAAQQAMIASGRYSHPFYWGGFTLTGGRSG